MATTRPAKQLAQQYHDDGFVVLPKAVDAKRLAELNAAIDQVRNGFSADRHRAVFTTSDRDQGRDDRFFASAETVEYFLEEDALDGQGELTCPLEQAMNKIGHALHDHVPAVGAFARDRLIRETLTALGLERPQVWQTMVIFKQPRIGGAVRWHQDASYLYTTPATVIGIWVALEDASLENGCLLVAPGQHRSPLRERYRVDWETRLGSLETLDQTPWPDEADTLALEVEAGSVVFFSDHLPHASAANRSLKSRRALTLHCANADAHWSESNWLQRPTLAPFLLE